MLARVATFNALPGDVDPEAVALLRKTVRETPGFVAGFQHDVEWGCLAPRTGE